MSRFHCTLGLLTCLLLGCRGNAADPPTRTTGETAQQATGAPRYAGETALALLYLRDAKGDTTYICSGALAALDIARTAQPGLLTASHCFTEPDSSNREFVVSLDDGNSFYALKHAWIGDNMTGADIAFAEFDSSLDDALRANVPLAVAPSPQALRPGDTLWTWGNPDNQGRALTLGYVMNPQYRKPPIAGTLDGAAVSLDLRGYIVAELNIAPGSSGGMVLGEAGLIGVVSADFKHSSEFRTVFVTPIARLRPLFEHPPKALGQL